jgi:hypothetical protein
MLPPLLVAFVLLVALPVGVDFRISALPEIILYR